MIDPENFYNKIRWVACIVPIHNSAILLFTEIILLEYWSRRNPRTGRKGKSVLKRFAYVKYYQSFIE
jgi:hypothetical protein